MASSVTGGRAEDPEGAKVKADIRRTSDGLSVGGQAVDLTPAEFGMLRVLSLNAGRVTTYEALLDQVWSDRRHLPCHSRMAVTTPEPTVRPPSRMANRRPVSIAIGAISSAVNFRLSPGITISVPSGSVTVPVTSVVRK